MGVHVGGLDVNPNGWLPLMGAIARCHCWAAIAGDRGVGVQVCGLDVVTLLAAVAGCHCWAPLLGCHCWGLGGVGVQVGGLDVVTLLGAVAGCWG